jgi:hypothetical protein
LHLHLIKEPERRHQKTAGGPVFHEQSLHFIGGRVEQIIEGGVLLNVFAIDVDAAPNQGELFVSNRDPGFRDVARSEYGPAQSGASPGIGFLQVGTRCDQLLGFVQTGQDVFFLSPRESPGRAPAGEGTLA